MATYHRAIKVTVDGPREPRSESTQAHKHPICVQLALRRGGSPNAFDAEKVRAGLKCVGVMFIRSEAPKSLFVPHKMTIFNVKIKIKKEDLVKCEVSFLKG